MQNSPKVISKSTMWNEQVQVLTAPLCCQGGRSKAWVFSVLLLFEASSFAAP